MVKTAPVDSYVVVKRPIPAEYIRQIQKKYNDSGRPSVNVEFVNTFDDKEPAAVLSPTIFLYGEEGWNLKQVTDDTDDSIANPHNTFGNK